MNTGPITNVAGQTSDTIAMLALSAIQVINLYIVPLIFALAFIYFIWGAFRYFIAGKGGEESTEQGRKFFVQSIIGFVIMISIWGIVNLIIGSLPLNNNVQPHIPTLTPNGSSQTGNTTNTLDTSGGTNVTDNNTSGTTYPEGDCRNPDILGVTGACQYGTTCARSGAQAGQCVPDSRVNNQNQTQTQN